MERAPFERGSTYSPARIMYRCTQNAAPFTDMVYMSVMRKTCPKANEPNLASPHDIWFASRCAFRPLFTARVASL